MAPHGEVPVKWHLTVSCRPSSINRGTLLNLGITLSLDFDMCTSLFYLDKTVTLQMHVVYFIL